MQPSENSGSILPRSGTALTVGLLCLAGALLGGTQIVPVVPDGLTPLPSFLDQRVRMLVRAAERYRGLQLEHPVQRGAIGVEALRKAVAEDLAKDLPPPRMAEVESALKAFSFMPESMSLATYLPELL